MVESTDTSRPQINMEKADSSERLVLIDQTTHLHLPDDSSVK
jgi:hypothetical protein